MSFVDWQVNIPSILAIVGAALVLYGRIVKLETKIDPLWEWWNQNHRPRTQERGQSPERDQFNGR